MKQFNKEFMTQHLLVLCAMSIIGALVRYARHELILMGASP